MTHEEKIKLAAQCLMGVGWDLFDIEQLIQVREHLDWLLDNKDEIAEGYPMGVMNRECEVEIMDEVEKIHTRK